MNDGSVAKARIGKSFIETLAGLATSMENINWQLADTANRLLGAEPDSGRVKGPTPPEPDYFVSEMVHLIGRLDGEICSYRHTVERLQDFI